MAWHAYRADMRIKTIDFGKRVRSHYSYLANTVDPCFYNTLAYLVTQLTFYFFVNPLATDFRLHASWSTRSLFV